MPVLKFNFDDIPDSVVAEGEVEVTITKIELKTSQSSGNPYLNWEFTISEGDFENSKIWMITSLTEKALFRLKQICESLGYEHEIEFEVDEDTNQVIYPNLVGTAVTLDVYHEEYQGRKQARVKEIVDYHTYHHLPSTAHEPDEEDDGIGYSDDEEDDDNEFASLPDDEGEEELEVSAPASKVAPKRPKK